MLKLSKELSTRGIRGGAMTTTKIQDPTKCQAYDSQPTHTVTKCQTYSCHEMPSLQLQPNHNNDDEPPPPLTMIRRTTAAIHTTSNDRDESILLNFFSAYDTTNDRRHPYDKQCQGRVHSFEFLFSLVGYRRRRQSNSDDEATAATTTIGCRCQPAVL